MPEPAELFMAIIIKKTESYKNRNKSVEERFWEKCDKTETCWIWRSAQDCDGYGIFQLSNPRKTVKAHRFAYVIFFKKPVGNLFVCHTCDNPSCVNPAHLFLGTAKDNRSDCMNKQRHAHGETHASKTNPQMMARGERISTAKLKESDVIIIRENVANGLPRAWAAEMFGVSNSCIDAIMQGKSWKHLPQTPMPSS